MNGITVVVYCLWPITRVRSVGPFFPKGLIKAGFQQSLGRPQFVLLTQTDLSCLHR